MYTVAHRLQTNPPHSPPPSVHTLDNLLSFSVCRTRALILTKRIWQIWRHPHVITLHNLRFPLAGRLALGTLGASFVRLTTMWGNSHDRSCRQPLGLRVVSSDSQQEMGPTVVQENYSRRNKMYSLSKLLFTHSLCDFGWPLASLGFSDL